MSSSQLKTVRFPIAYGFQPIRGWRGREREESAFNPGLQQTVSVKVVQQILGLGPWDGPERLYADAFLIPPADYTFHPGLANDAADLHFPDEEPHPGKSYWHGRLPYGFSEEQTDDVFGIFRTRRTPDFNGAGQQIDVNGNVVGNPLYPPDPAHFFFKPNQANCVGDQLIVLGQRPRSVVNWPEWTLWRDWNDELIWWDDARYTPRSIALTPTVGGVLAADTYYIRVATLRGADLSSASRETASIAESSVVIGPGGSNAFQVGWLIKGDELDPVAPPTDQTAYRVYIRKGLGGAWVTFDTGGGAATRSLLVTTLAGAAASGPPPDLATQPLQRQIKRFECGLFFVPPYDMAQAIDSILASACADFQWSGYGSGQYRNDMLRFMSPVTREHVFELNLAEIAAGSFRTHQVDTRNRPNVVEVHFRDRDDEFLAQADPVILKRDELIAADGQEKVHSINIGSAYRSHAQRVCSFYARMLCDMDQIATLKASPRTYHVLPGDTMLVTHTTPDWEDVKFMAVRKGENVEKAIGDPTTLRLYDDELYSDTDHSPLPRPLRPARANPFVPPPAAVSLGLTVVPYFLADYTYAPIIRGAVVFAQYGLEQQARIWWRKPGEAEFVRTGILVDQLSDGSGGTFEIPNASVGLHAFKAVTEVASTGVNNDEATTPYYEIEVVELDPLAPTDFRVERWDRHGVRLEFAPAYASVIHYELQRLDYSTYPNVLNEEWYTVARFLANGYTDTVPPGVGQYRYRIRAVGRGPVYGEWVECDFDMYTVVAPVLAVQGTFISEALGMHRIAITHGFNLKGRDAVYATQVRVVVQSIWSPSEAIVLYDKLMDGIHDVVDVPIRPSDFTDPYPVIGGPRLVFVKVAYRLPRDPDFNPATGGVGYFEYNDLLYPAPTTIANADLAPVVPTGVKAYMTVQSDGSRAWESAPSGGTGYPVAGAGTVGRSAFWTAVDTLGAGSIKDDGSGHIAVGNTATVNGSYGANETVTMLNVRETITLPQGRNITGIGFAGKHYGVLTYLTLAPTGNYVGSSPDTIANQSYLETAANASTYYGLLGTYGMVWHYGTGAINNVRGVRGEVSNRSTGSMALGYGAEGQITNVGGGTISEMYGIRAIANNLSGSVSGLYGVNVGVTQGGTNTFGAFGVSVRIDVTAASPLARVFTGSTVVASGINLVDQYTLFALNPSGAGTITNNYGLYIADHSAKGTSISRNVMSKGVNAINEFEGFVKGKQFQSTVSSGTAPLTVLSSTMVAGLNAEQVGGQNLAALDARYLAAGTTYVSTFNGRSGPVVPVANDYTFLQIDRTVSSLADLTTRSASDLSSGTLPDARFPAVLPAISGVNLTALNASNLTVGTAPTARLGSGTANASTFLRGDSSWAAVVTSITGTANQVLASAATGAVTFSLPQSIDTAATVRFAHVALGTALKTWTSGQVVQGPTAATFYGVSGDFHLVSNAYFNTTWRYMTASVAGNLYLYNGDLIYRNAAAGAADGALTWADRFVVLAAGNVGIGTSSPDAKLEVLNASGTQLRLSYTDSAAYADLAVSSGGTLTLTPTGSIALGPAGGQVDPVTGYATNLGQLSKKYLSVHAAELWVETLVAQNTIATIGGRVLVGPTTSLIADLAPAAATIDVKHNNLASGDVIYLEAGGSVEFMAVTSGASVIAGGYRYSVSRNLDGSGANQWYAGDAAFNTGTTGSGFIDLYSVRGVKSASQAGPSIVGNVRNSGTYNDYTEHWAIGNLAGLYGYGSTTYGVAFGQYAAAKAHLTIDATNGYRIFTGLSTVVGQWANDGTITVGQVAASQSNVLISAGSLQLRNNTAARIQLNADGSGFLANSLISFSTSGNLNVAGAATIAGWYIGVGLITPTAVTNGTMSAGGVFTHHVASFWGAGFASVEAISGDGFVEFVPPLVNSEGAAGLKTASGFSGYAGINFAFYMAGGFSLYVFENGGNVGVGPWGWSPGVTKLRIERIGTTLSYYVDGLLFRQVLGVTTAPLYFGTDFHTGSSTIGPITMTAAAGSSIMSGGIAMVASGTPASNRIYVGTGVYNSAATPFYVDGSGRLSLKDKLAWDGSTLAIVGSGTFTGSVTATSGAIAGWTLAATRLSSTNVHLDQAGQYLAMGATPPSSYGNNVGIFLSGASGGRLSIYGNSTNYLQWDGAKLLLGANNLTIDASGNLTATSATLSGAITATSGAINGPMTMAGASSSIAIGATPPTSSSAGTGIWLDRTGLYGLASSTRQAIFDAATGAITAGGGVVKLDANGIYVVGTTFDATQRNYSIRDDLGNVIGKLGGIYAAGVLTAVSLSTLAVAGRASTQLNLTANSPASGSPSISLRASVDGTAKMQLDVSTDVRVYNANTEAMRFDTTNNLLLYLGDIEIVTTTRGLILKAPNGSRWRATVANTGVVTWTSI